MRALCRSVTGVMLVAALVAGCGSSGGDDRLTLRFLGFDSTGITQVDSVNPTSADIDVVMENPCPNGVTPEPFANTQINANFVNNEAADISIQQVTIDFGANSGLGGNGIRQHNIDAHIPGGRCTNGLACTVDADCGGNNTCTHTPSVATFLLIDVDDKLHINPAILAQATNVTITFSAIDDANHSFQVTTHYDVVFADFSNCPGGA